MYVVATHTKVTNQHRPSSNALTKCNIATMLLYHCK